MFKIITEIGPLVAFFFGYKSGSILNATLYMLFASALCICATYLMRQKVNKISLVSTLLLSISCGLTFLSGNNMFIKIKPTILYCLFSIGFFVTNFKWEPAIKYVLGAAVKLKDNEKWKNLNTRFMWFFLSMAILNEIIWRNFSEDTWVNFKIFGAFPIILIFISAQMPFIIRNKEENI